MAERLWFKLWRSWWTCESHAEVSADALNVGPVLMSFVRWTPGEDDGWAVNEKGRPVTCNALARRAKWTPKRVVEALQELEEVGTVALRSDGAWGFPKYGPWQETADAARKRKTRGMSGGQSGGMSGGQSAAIGEAEVEEQQQASLAGQPPAAKRAVRSNPKRDDDPFAADVDRVLDALHAARTAVKPDLTRLRKRDHIRARLADGARVDQLLAVIAYAGEECRKDPTKLEWLNAETPFRPRNWESRLARAEAWQAQPRSTGQRFDATPEQLHRERAERAAQIAAEEGQL